MRTQKTYFHVLAGLRKTFTPAELALAARVCSAVAGIDPAAGWNLTVKGFGERLASFETTVAQIRAELAQAEPSKPSKG